MSAKVKNGLIIALIVIIGLFGLFGGRTVKRYQKEIASLKYDKTSLQLQITNRELVIKFQQDSIKKLDAEKERIMVLFKAKDKQIVGLTADLNNALSQLNGITSDSSYQFLQHIAYNYPGALKYLFNELQIKYIHSDYLTARSSEKIIPVLTSQVNDCKVQFGIRDNIESGLKDVIGLQKQNLTDCQKINQDNDKIIKDTEKQRDKEKHRKNFWRFTASVATGVTIIVSVFGL